MPQLEVQPQSTQDASASTATPPSDFAEALQNYKLRKLRASVPGGNPEEGPSNTMQIALILLPSLLHSFPDRSSKDYEANLIKLTDSVAVHPLSTTLSALRGIRDTALAHTEDKDNAHVQAVSLFGLAISETKRYKRTDPGLNSEEVEVTLFEPIKKAFEIALSVLLETDGRTRSPRSVTEAFEDYSKAMQNRVYSHLGEATILPRGLDEYDPPLLRSFS